MAFHVEKRLHVWLVVNRYFHVSIRELATGYVQIETEKEYTITLIDQKIKQRR